MRILLLLLALAAPAAFADSRVTPEHRAAVEAVMAALAHDMERDLAEEYARLDFKAIVEEIGFGVYGAQFTTEELQQLAAFYVTPAGKKMLALETAPGGDALAPEEREEVARFNQTPAARHVLQPGVQRQIDQVLESHLAPARLRVVEKYRPLFREAMGMPAR